MLFHLLSASVVFLSWNCKSFPDRIDETEVDKIQITVFDNFQWKGKCRETKFQILKESEISEIIKCIDLKKKHVQESLANKRAIVRFNCFNSEKMKILEFDLDVETDYGPMIGGLSYKDQYSIPYYDGAKLQSYVEALLVEKFGFYIEGERIH